MERTIAAIATAPGTSGLSVIRISGENAFEIADKIFQGKRKTADAESHRILYGNLVQKGTIIDTATASVFRKPNSYTGENIVEFGCHGGVVVADLVLNALLSEGAELAEPGEFTKKAFLNGKLDLAQVEAVADLIHTVSVPGAKTAARQLAGEFTLRLAQFRKQLIEIASLLELELDFSEEDVEFVDRTDIIVKINSANDVCKNLSDSYKSAEILRSGFVVGIAGFPNSGKSTLFNSLIDRYRAIVTAIAGTTRDYLQETFYIDGIAIRLIDTAGIRDTDDVVEIEGIKMVDSIMEQSNLILVLNDACQDSKRSDELFKNISEKYSNTQVLLVQNKADLIVGDTDINGILISAKEKIGLNELRNIISQEARKSAESMTDILVNNRQRLLLQEASKYLTQSIEAIGLKMENAVVAYEIRQAAMTLGKITGDAWDDDVLNAIFSGFCIGK